MSNKWVTPYCKIFPDRPKDAHLWVENVVSEVTNGKLIYSSGEEIRSKTVLRQIDLMIWTNSCQVTIFSMTMKDVRYNAVKTNNLTRRLQWMESNELNLIWPMCMMKRSRRAHSKSKSDIFDQCIPYFKGQDWAICPSPILRDRFHFHALHESDPVVVRPVWTHWCAFQSQNKIARLRYRSLLHKYGKS